MNRLKHIADNLTKSQSKSQHCLQISNQSKFNQKSQSLQIYQSKDCYFIKNLHLKKFYQGRDLYLYDPSLGNTICDFSKICFIDGQKSILEYRGYRIQQLAQKSTYLEVVFLLIFGELPSSNQLQEFSSKIMNHTRLPVQLQNTIKKFRYNAHPMGILISSISALSEYHDYKYQNCQNPKSKNQMLYNLLGMIPSIAANSYRHYKGMHFNLPNHNRGYIENFLYMIDKMNEKDYRPHPKLVKAIDTLFIIHAQHQMSCSTALLRQLAYQKVDLANIISAAAGALYGPRHGGANAAVIKMLEQIKDKDNISKYLQLVKEKKKILYGFGHRVYKNHDPRAKIAKRKVLQDVFQICGTQPLLEIALQLQKQALNDTYFLQRKLYPNVDFYNGLIYKAMGFQTQIYPVLFVLPLVGGWLSHWVQCIENKEQVKFYPKQLYIGHRQRKFLQISQRRNNLTIPQSDSENYLKRKLFL